MLTPVMREQIKHVEAAQLHFHRRRINSVTDQSPFMYIDSNTRNV